MNKPMILVTGASGKTGGAVVSLLRERGWPVRAVVRSRDGRSEALERLGAEVAVADMFDPEGLAAAMRGTARAYYVPVFHPNMIQSATAFSAAAHEAKLEVVVGLSQWLASPSHPSLHTRQHWLADELFARSRGFAYVKLNPGYFADSTLRLVDFAAHFGILPNFTGDSRNAPPSNEDIARVAAAVLMRPDRHVGRSYRPTGPKLLSTHDVARVLTRVLGRNVAAVPMPSWLFLKAARMDGVGAFDATSLLYYFEDHKQGAFELGAPNTDVLDVTGAPAEDFEVTARRYAALPKAQRTFRNTVRAWFDFLRLPLHPGYDAAAYERGMAFPEPPSPRFAMQDATWRREREQPVPRLVARAS